MPLFHPDAVSLRYPVHASQSPTCLLSRCHVRPGVAIPCIAIANLLLIPMPFHKKQKFDSGDTHFTHCRCHSILVDKMQDLS